MIGLSRTPALLLALIVAAACANRAAAQTVQTIAQPSGEFSLEQVHAGLGIPWGMTFVAADRLLITERDGGVWLLDLVSLAARRIDGAPEVVAEGQGGLLDVAAGPSFARDGWIYFTYSKPVESEAATTLARARLDGDRLVDWQDLLVTDSATGARRHFGSRIAFDDAGHVFFGVGDRGERDAAQNRGNHIGAILRLNLDGSVPADNPFVGDPAARDEIWTYGHRNPQGLYYDNAARRLWSIEHGPRGGDEINLILEGRNYGWPVVSHGKEYWGPVSIGEGTSKPGLEDPRKVYIPSIAPGSLLVYRGEAFPGWRGNLFAGALKLRHLNRVSLSDSGEIIGEERLLEDFDARIRALAESPEGWIYLSTDDGRILRLRPRE
jgi:glucose/arabinose dehydrogenase